MTPETQLIAELGSKLIEALAKNTASMISSKITAIMAKKDSEEKINGLIEIINELIADKSELIIIAQSYEQEFSSQRIKDNDIKYITDTFIPKIKEISDAMGLNQDKDMDSVIETLTPLISKETLTILQLLGFNFRKAIGEPLTLLLHNVILSKMPVSKEVQAEMDLEIVKASKSPQAINRISKIKKEIKKQV